MKATYEITFDRIGRNHNVNLLTVEAGSEEDVEDAIWRYARKFCISAGIDVNLDLAEMKGSISAGMHRAGSFTIKEKTDEQRD